MQVDRLRQGDLRGKTVTYHGAIALPLREVHVARRPRPTPARFLTVPSRGTGSAAKFSGVETRLPAAATAET